MILYLCICRIIDHREQHRDCRENLEYVLFLFPRMTETFSVEWMVMKRRHDRVDADAAVYGNFMVSVCVYARWR